MLGDTSQSKSLPNLHRLTLARPYGGVSRAERWEPLQLAPWMKDLAGLHTLELHQSTEDKELINILRLMEGHNYPNLKVLTLDHILTRGIDLWIFLRPHLGALESLTIETPVIFPRESVQKEILDNISASCQVRLTPSYKPSVSQDDEEVETQAWWDSYHDRLERGR